MTPLRLHLRALGRHLHRSVLHWCLPAPALRELLRDHPALQHRGDAELRDAAVALAGRAHAAVDRLHQALDTRHAQALQQFEAAADATALGALWGQALRGDPQDRAGAYWALLTHPQATRALRHLALGDMQMLQPDEAAAEPLARLLERRSFAPRRLGPPGPDAEHLELMLQAALSAPDHGRLCPWRVIEFRAGQRAALADLFVQEKLRRDPLALAADLRRARTHALQAPCLLAFVVSPRTRTRVPAREQWLAAGGALGNLLNAAHQLGYGGIVLSGDRCFDPLLAAQLGLGESEVLAGFVSIGTPVAAAPAVQRRLPQSVWSCWMTAPQRPHAGEGGRTDLGLAP